MLNKSETNQQFAQASLRTDLPNLQRESHPAHGSPRTLLDPDQQRQRNLQKQTFVIHFCNTVVAVMPSPFLVNTNSLEVCCHKFLWKVKNNPTHNVCD